MSIIIEYMYHNWFFIHFILWLRGMLSENRIPDVLFERLKIYTPMLSENIPDIEKINRCLEQDIGYLNSRGELLYIQRLNRKKVFPGYTRKPDKSIIEYYAVKIIGYQDILELNAVRDRVFTIDINMDICNRIYNFFYRNNTVGNKNFYYQVKLSSLESMF